MSDESFELTVNGCILRVRQGTSVAAAILNSLEISPSACTPICGMGVCWGCRTTIDGRPDVRSCLVPAAPGMTVSTVRSQTREIETGPRGKDHESTSE